jgi:ligand-binding SRPBCC domain-containing protein
VTPPRVVFGRDGGLVTLATDLFLPQPRAVVFPFFADAFNLEAITPPLLHFAVLTPPPIAMAVGLRIDYRLRLHGLPLRWQSEISAWEPPHRFVDEQRRGPYRVWIHEHTFTETEGGTQVRDLVRYAVPGGAAIERLFVRPRLAEIFRYRQERIAAIFAAESPGRRGGEAP